MLSLYCLAVLIHLAGTAMWTLGKHILQIQVEVFHAVATTAENGEDGSYYLAL